LFGRILFCLALAAVPLACRAGAVLDHVRTTGTLACGSITEPGDFTKGDTHGRTEAFGADICRAVAAAVLGDASLATVFGFHDEAEGMTALQSGRIALLVGASPNPGLAARYGVAFGNPVFFDGQGFLVRKGSGIDTLADLTGKQVCFIGGTPAEDDVTRVLKHRGIGFLPFPFEEMGEMQAALVTGHCRAQTGDVSVLASGRTGFHGQVHNFVILPDLITLDPLCPVVRNGDPDWARVIDWVGFTLVQAEASGVTRANAESMARDGDEQIRTLLGSRRSAQGGLGLPDGWGLRVIQAVGNYGEIFDRDWGAIGVARGPNRLWTSGGLLWAPVFR
jgi:general L-amino acid transport system substrate-binding protein